MSELIDASWEGPKCSVLVKLPSRLLSDLATDAEKDAVAKVRQRLFALSAALNELISILPEGENDEVSVSLIHRALCSE